MIHERRPCVHHQLNEFNGGLKCSPQLDQYICLERGLSFAAAEAQAFDQSKYPDWAGGWRRIPTPGVTGQPAYDQTKRLGPAQNAPLTPEAQAILKASMEDQAKGGQGNYPTYVCLSPGMPRMMTPYAPIEFVITPDTVHMFIEHVHDSRRVYIDGRDWPKEITPTLQGYSIGKWIDEDGDGKYDVLEIETRGFKGPRAFDASGMPLHSRQPERRQGAAPSHKSRPNVMLNEITTIDHSLTRPWTVTKVYGRTRGRELECPGGKLRRRQRPCRNPRPRLFPRRRRQPDAGQEGRVAAGSAVF